MSVALITSEPFGYSFPFKNLPYSLRKDLDDIFGVITSLNNINLLKSEDYFYTVGDCQSRVNAIDQSLHPAHKIAKSAEGQLKRLHRDTVLAFVDTDTLSYDELVLIKQAAGWIKKGESLVHFLEQVGAERQRVRELGYSVRTYTDLGFDYILPGNNQRCRFCGLTLQDGATFNKDAHAISFFVGNKHLLGCGECDACNEFFGRELEPHLHRYYQPTMIQEGFTGRGDNPHIKGENFKQQLDRFEYYLDDIEQGDIEHLEMTRGMNITMTDKTPIIKAKVYRTLCKFAISLLTDKELDLYKKTIRWIRLKGGGSHRIPTTFRYEKLPLVETPTISLLTPIKWTNRNARCVVVFRFVTNLWVYALPFAQNDRYDLVNDELKRIIKELNLVDGERFTDEDFSIETRTGTNTHLSFEFGPDSKIQRVYDMSPEERKNFNEVTKGLDRPTFIVSKSQS